MEWWRSTNGGTTWTPLDDMMANLAVCSLVMDPTNSNVIYAGTGEGFNNIDAIRGDGIFKTTNGGSNWTQLASTHANADFHFVNGLVMTGRRSGTYCGYYEGYISLA